ncbi:Hypothetical protein PHPALM_349 [Phytophthora palmivora]|uniref:Tyr recombinase domain-containing protein n=1 Tax=Phytophthora palmivora TaxID=4796 RepID=A0A2P4YV32_9STRA|nr:Hypothetical protein PHPALM_349 [Phytophthora palmivora]
MLRSDNPFAQELVRSIGLSEALHRFRMSPRHLPGAANVLADAGSRTGDGAHRVHWTVSSWTQTPVPAGVRSLVLDILHQLPTQALAAGSHSKYEATWRQWAAWCHANGYSPWLSGSRARDLEQLIHFAVWCWQPGPGRRTNSASTILSKVGHINWYHRRFSGFPVGFHTGHQLAMQGMQRLSAPPSRKLPISTRLLRQLRSQCNFDQAHDRVLWGSAVMGYFYMLRRSEYLSDTGVTKPYAIQIRDVTFHTASGDQTTSKDQATFASIRFRGSKIDQVGVGTTRTLERSGSRWLSPTLAARELVRHGWRIGLGNEDHLCSTAIKAAAVAVGENPTQNATHSMRSGGATALFSSGVDRLAIKHFGRWKSDAYEQYARIDNVTLTGLAEAVVNGDKQFSTRPYRPHQNGAIPRRTLGCSHLNDK